MYAETKEEMLEFLNGIPELIPAIYDDKDGWILNADVAWKDNEYQSKEPIFISIYEDGWWKLSATFKISGTELIDVTIDIESTGKGYMLESQGVSIISKIGLIKGYMYEGVHIMAASNNDAILYKSNITEKLSNNDVQCYVAKLRNDDKHPPVYCFVQANSILFQTIDLEKAETFLRENGN